MLTNILMVYPMQFWIRKGMVEIKSLDSYIIENLDIWAHLVQVQRALLKNVPLVIEAYLMNLHRLAHCLPQECWLSYI